MHMRRTAGTIGDIDPFLSRGESGYRRFLPLSTPCRLVAPVLCYHKGTSMTKFQQDTINAFNNVAHALAEQNRRLSAIEARLARPTPKRKPIAKRSRAKS